jgi:hypothetical protein
MKVIMKTGIELIAEEREKQIKKWGTTEAHDIDHEYGELKTASLYCLTGLPDYLQYGWELFEVNISEKTELARLRIAGALIAAEIDRLQVTQP